MVLPKFTSNTLIKTSRDLKSRSATYVIFFTSGVVKYKPRGRKEHKSEWITLPQNRVDKIFAAWGKVMTTNSVKILKENL